MATMPNTPTTESLPEACVRLVQRTVRHTRLWSWERREIRAELESHFAEALRAAREDGLAAEASVEAACREFGDPKLTARLMRRAKRRKRPMIWKIISAATWAAAGTTVVVGGMAAWLMSGKAEPSVDYVARMNEPVLATAEADRAWPLWQDILLRLTPRSSTEMPNPDDEGWDEAEAWLDENADLLPEIHAVAQLPVYGFVYGSDDIYHYIQDQLRRDDPDVTDERLAEIKPPATDRPQLIAVLLPSLRDFRQVTRLLVFQSRAALADQDVAAAWDALDTSHRISMQLIQGRTLIERMMAAAMIGLAIDEMGALLANQGADLTDQQLDIMLSGSLNTTPGTSLSLDYESERMMFYDIVQYLFTDDGNGSGRLIADPDGNLEYLMEVTQAEGDESGEVGQLLRQIAKSAIHADRRDTLEKYDQIWARHEERIHMPMYDPNYYRIDRRIEAELSTTTNKLRYGLIGMIMPAMGRADLLMRETRMRHEATQLLLALTAYRLDHGEYPSQLRDLQGDYLDDLPEDVYSGAGLVYQPREDGVPLLYSVGRNLVDDGGDITRTAEPYGNGQKTSRADIRIWPPRSK